MVCEKFPLINALCAHVIEIPDESRIIVLSIGILIGLNGLIPTGGHCIPISTEGDKLLWKNAQKNDEKNNTSDVINKIIPHFIPLITFLVWSPWNVDSRTTSRHHWNMVNKVIVVPVIISHNSLKWNHNNIPDAIVISPIDPESGHGLLSTKWNGWFFIVKLL